MERGHPESQFGLVPVIEQLSDELVAELGLLEPKEQFEALDVDTCLLYQEGVAERLEAVMAPLLADSGTEFVVVSGETVYASRVPFTEFDQVGFSHTQPFLTTVITRPAPATPGRITWLVDSRSN